MNELFDLDEEGKCPCGSVELTLAKDCTHYDSGVVLDGKWFGRGNEKAVDIEAEQAIRLFCPSCGTYFNVPSNV